MRNIKLGTSTSFVRGFGVLALTLAGALVACGGDDSDPLGASGKGGASGKDGGASGTGGLGPGSGGSSGADDEGGTGGSGNGDGGSGGSSDDEAGAETGAEAAGPRCGNGTKEGSEACDDSNTLDGDGCSSLCTDRSRCDTCVATNASVDVYNCPDEALPSGSAICDAVQGTATNGPAAGVGRAELCRAVYTCALKTGCAANQITDCYCGSSMAPRAWAAPRMAPARTTSSQASKPAMHRRSFRSSPT